MVLGECSLGVFLHIGIQLLFFVNPIRDDVPFICNWMVLEEFLQLPAEVINNLLLNTMVLDSLYSSGRVPEIIKKIPTDAP